MPRPSPATLPHPGDRTGHQPQRAPAGWQPPACPVSRRRTVTPEGEEALAEAQAATDLVRSARTELAEHAARRRAAVLCANIHGATYSVIAARLGISVPGVQRLVDEARRAETVR